MPEINDKALTVLDLSVFYTSQPMEAYFSEGYVETYGEKHSGLTDREVSDLIFDLEEKGLLTLTPRTIGGVGTRVIVSITQKGFQHWDASRRPDWGKYVSTSTNCDSKIRHYVGFNHAICWTAFQHSMSYGEVGAELKNLKTWYQKGNIFFEEREIYTIEFEETHENRFFHEVEESYWTTRPYWNRLGSLLEVPSRFVRGGMRCEQE